MKYKTLDEIAMSVLLQKGYSVHWYIQAMKLASDCLRELQFDVIGIVKSQRLELNSYGAVDLPCDYVDYVRIGLPTSQSVLPSGAVLNYNRLTNLDVYGNKIPYAETGDMWGYGFTYGYWHYPHNQGFSVVEERGQIQFPNSSNCGFIILDYLSDGSQIDNGCMVHPYAQACIEAYVFWQFKSKNRSYGAGETSYEKQEYDRQYRILRGRKNDITPENVKAMMHRRYGKQV